MGTSLVFSMGLKEHAGCLESGASSIVALDGNGLFGSDGRSGELVALHFILVSALE
jgi:hypothetical protein